MDLFIAGCQGLGLALAVGVLFGAPALTGAAGRVAMVLAALVGAFLFGASLTPEDHPAWPGWVVGFPVALLAYVVAHRVSAGAMARPGAERGAIAVYIALAAIALGGICLLPVSPVSIVAFIAIAALALAQGRRSDSKHAGLRSLR